VTSVNAQYRTFLANMRRITGLAAVEMGSAPDERHLDSGGYHVGPDDIRRIGRWLLDYSTRQARDKIGGNDSAAFDIGDDWPNGGRAAWLRFNALLLRQLQASDPALAAVRAINFSPDGRLCRRYDTFNRSQGVIASTDTVYMHTHGETWRDQAGKPALDRAFRRIEQMAAAAIANTPLPPEGDDMTEDQAQMLNDMAWRLDALYSASQVIRGGRYVGEPVPANVVIATLANAVNSAGGSVDTAAVLAGIDVRLAALAAEQRDAVADLGEGGAAQVRAGLAAVGS
jgi:hypothetical protein